MYCKNCGASLPEGAKFCNSCGNDVNKVKKNNIEYNTEIDYDGGTFKATPKTAPIATQTNPVILVIIILAIVMTFFGIVFVFIGVSVLSSSNIKEYNYNDELYESSSLVVNNLDLAYNKNKWKEINVSSSINTNGLEKGIEYGSYRVIAIYEKVDKIYTTEYFAYQMANLYEDYQYTVISRDVRKYIGGKTWYSVEYKNGSNTYYQVFYVDGYDTYSITYMAPSSEYYSGKSEAMLVIESAMMY